MVPTRIKDHLKNNFILAYPVMITMLGQVMTGVADSIMIGWTGAIPLAASSLANVIFSLAITFGIGVSFAITPFVAEYHGAGKNENIVKVLQHGLLINTCVAILLMVLVYCCSFLLPLANQPLPVVQETTPYLNILTWAIFPTLLFQTFRQFAEGLHDTKMAMVIVIGTNLLNIALNYILIFGMGEIPPLGLLGAGYATLIARIMMALWMALYIYHGKKFKSFRKGFKVGKYHSDMIKRLLNMGIPSGFQFIFEVGAFGFSAIMMGWIGTPELAAHQIAINLATISYMTTSGLGAAATIRVGYFLGQGDRKMLREAAFTLIGMALFLMLVWASLFIFGRMALPKLYINDPEVWKVASPLLIIAGFFQLSDGLQVVCAGALRGLKDVKIPSLLIFVSYWILGLPIGYLLAFHTPLKSVGIWTGLLIGLTLTASALVIRFYHLSKKESSTP